MSEIVDFLALVAVCAPDRLPQEEFGEPLDLERAFVELRLGLESASGEVNDAEAVERFRAKVDQAKAFYDTGEPKLGSVTLQRLEAELRSVLERRG